MKRVLGATVLAAALLAAPGLIPDAEAKIAPPAVSTTSGGHYLCLAILHLNVGFCADY